MPLNTLSVALFNQIVQVGLTHVAYAANFLHCYSIRFSAVPAHRFYQRTGGLLVIQVVALVLELFRELFHKHL